MEMAKIAHVDSSIRIKLDQRVVRVEGDGDGNPCLVFDGVEFEEIHAPAFHEEFIVAANERRINLDMVYDSMMEEVRRQQIVGLITDAMMK
jgi:hypothetical protein